MLTVLANSETGIEGGIQGAPTYKEKQGGIYRGIPTMVHPEVYTGRIPTMVHTEIYTGRHIYHPRYTLRYTGRHIYHPRYTLWYT